MNCQICNHSPLRLVLSLGYMPPVNLMRPVGVEPEAEPWMPTDLYVCPQCELVQLGHVGKQDIVFPPSYPYTSGSTRNLRENFADLAAKARDIVGLKDGDFVVDIGSNDGTLLSNFMPQQKVLGIEPTDVANLARARGITTLQKFFNRQIAATITRHEGRAKLVTAANVFAHIPDPHEVVDGILDLLTPDGVFISENHYLFSLIDRLQFDTVYHEHLRYYSIHALRRLFDMHGLRIFKIERIPTHGGSIRVYAARHRFECTDSPVEPTGQALMAQLDEFAANVAKAKIGLLDRICTAKSFDDNIVGVGAPSRGSTVVSYCGLDHNMIDYVCETRTSLKVGRYMPGTSIPVVDEQRMLDEQPEQALIFSWHIADEIKHKLRSKGYRGHFLIPVPPWT